MDGFFNESFRRLNRVLESGQDYSVYTAGTDVANIAASTSHISGQYSIEFDKTGATVNAALITKELGGEDLNDFAVDGAVTFGAYLSTLTNVAYLTVRLKEDASNYLEWALRPSRTGWTQHRISTLNGAQTGTGINWRKVNQLEVGVVMAAAGNTINNVRFDNIEFQADIPRVIFSRALTTALGASLQIGIGQKCISDVSGRIDSTAANDDYYVQLLDGVTLPADGAVTHIIAPFKIQHITGTDSWFDLDIGDGDGFIRPENGAWLVVSTTEFTKTIAGNIMSATALYV